MAGNVWFYILPINEDAKAIVDDVRNREHVVITYGPGAAAINRIQVVFRDDLKPHCILSFGRSFDSNIQCNPPGTAIGRRMAQRQCSFSFHNRCLIFRDHSELHTSTIFPEHLDSPEKWEMDQIPRQRAIPEYGDWLISMGGATFRLEFRKSMRKLHSLIISLLKLMINRWKVVAARFWREGCACDKDNSQCFCSD